MPTAVAAAQRDDIPQPAASLEFLGPYRGSGYKDAPYLVRRDDGSVVQLTWLLYLVARSADGRRNIDAIATRVSDEFGRIVSPANVAYLVDHQLRPLGLCDTSLPTVQRTVPRRTALELSLRAAVIPPRLVRRLTTVFLPLLTPIVVALGFLAFVAVDWWALARHGVARGTDDLLSHPTHGLLVLALALGAAFFHELGHATACRRAGATPGSIGVGVYLLWPACYTDVTDAYRLGRWGRISTDLGGLYFNAVFVAAIGGLYWATRAEALLVAILVQNIQMAMQFIPFLRLDGYYLLTDAIGVPDLFERLRSAIRRRHRRHRQSHALRPGVKVIVALWSVITTPLLAVGAVALAIGFPGAVGRLWDAGVVQWRASGRALADGRYADLALDAFQLGLLGVPAAGMLVLVGRLLPFRTLRTARRAKSVHTTGDGGRTTMSSKQESVEGHTLTVRRHGYDQSEVRALLQTVAARQLALQTELDAARAEIAQLRAISPEQALGAQFADLLQAIRDESARITDQAAKDAEALRASARDEVRALLAELGAIHDEAYRNELELVDRTVRRTEGLLASLRSEQRKSDEVRQRLALRLESAGDADRARVAPIATARRTRTSTKAAAPRT